jgi:hypothetical protein
MKDVRRLIERVMREQIYAYEGIFTGIFYPSMKMQGILFSVAF